MSKNAKVQVKRGRGRPDTLGNAIVSFIKSKPWNGRVVGLDSIFQAYSIERRNQGKLAPKMDVEFRCANIQIQNMLRAGKLVRMERGQYTIPEAAATIKAKAPKAKSKRKAKVEPVVDAPAVVDTPVVPLPNLKAGTEASE